MTEQEYSAIAAACDRLLRAPGTSLERIAIPMLHVINEHPGCIGQYEPLLRAAAGRVPPDLAVLARGAVRAGRALGRSLRRRAPEQPAEPSATASSVTDAASQVDVLIVSRLFNASQLDAEDDFYFGALQRFLRERGFRSVLVFVDSLARGNPRGEVTRPLGNERWVLPQLTSARVEAQLWRRCATARSELRRAAAREGQSPIDCAVAALASGQALSWGTAANLRLHAALIEVCRRLAPRIVLTTYEGDASERIIWHAARSAGRRPLCVGYQHTRLLERAHAIRRSLTVPGIDCDPDAILTLGDIPQAALAKSPGLSGVRLITYGSHRRAGHVEASSPNERPRACLVLPDGDERECVILFEFAVQCARQAPEITFLLRPHPIVRLPGLLLRHRSLRELPGNVAWSTGKAFQEDCAHARYCLYRGSSAVMYAVQAGVKPFYLARAGELSFDPLSALPRWRETVSTPEGFLSCVRSAEVAPDPAGAMQAAAFCDRYVSRVRPAAIDELLEMAAWEASNSRRASTELNG